MSFRYGQKDILKDIDLDFVKGNIYGFKGESGVGKLHSRFNIRISDSTKEIFNKWKRYFREKILEKITLVMFSGNLS